MWVPNVRCQLCIFRPLWDRDDYHSNYSVFEHCASCAELWEARAPRDLMLVFVCHHNHANGDIEAALPQREKSQYRSCCFCSAAMVTLGEERSCCTLLYIPFSSPRLMVALKRLG